MEPIVPWKLKTKWEIMSQNNQDKERTTKLIWLEIKRDILTNTSAIQKTIQIYIINLHSTKLENLREIDTFLDTYDLSKLNESVINNLYRLTTNEILRCYCWRHYTVWTCYVEN